MTLPLLLLFLTFFSLSSSLKNLNVFQLEQLVSKTEYVVVAITSEFTEQHKELSKRLIEELDRVQQILSNDPKVKIVGLLLDQNPEFGNDILTDLPAILIYREGHPRFYYGQRNGATLYGFLQELWSNEAVKVVTSKQDKKFFGDDHSVRVLGYFPSENENYQIFKQVAKHFQGDLLFGIVQDEKLAKTLKLKSQDEIILQKPGERPIQSNKIFSSREEMVSWIQENKRPLWGVLSWNNMYGLWQGSKTTFVLFLNNLEEHVSKTVISIFKTLAKQYSLPHDISFVIVSTATYKEFAQSFGLQDEDLPTFVIFHPIKRKEYFFPKNKIPLSIQTSKRWLDSFLSGKLDTSDTPSTPFYTDKDYIDLINSENYEKILNEPKKDILIEFYAPWCHHCAALSGHYRVVAKTMQLFPSIVVAAFDGEASVIPEKFNVASFPTLLFFPANRKDVPAVFEGYSRDAKGILEFVLEYQTTLDEESVETLRKLIEIQEGELDNFENEEEVESDIDTEFNDEN